MKRSCIEPGDGPRHHAWRNTGLDIVADVLCHTRVCDLCNSHQHRPFQTNKSWRETK